MNCLQDQTPYPKHLHALHLNTKNLHAKQFSLITLNALHTNNCTLLNPDTNQYYTVH